MDSFFLGILRSSFGVAATKSESMTGHSSRPFDERLKALFPNSDGAKFAGIDFFRKFSKLHEFFSSKFLSN
jgi:hypothetical protein